MKHLKLLGIIGIALVMSACSSMPSKVKTHTESSMSTNDPCVTRRANCSPEEAEASAKKYAEIDRRIYRLEERQHAAEIRETDNRITDNARMSDLGN